MNTTRAAASIMALASGAVVAYAGAASGLSQDGNLLITALGGLLVIDSLACFFGWRLAFAVSAAVSVLILATASIGWGSALSELRLGAVVLDLANVAASLLAFRSSTRLPEQANPMNLPVFG